MKMRLEVLVYVDGIVDPLTASFDDDVDAEGTMIAKYVHPIVTMALQDEISGPLTLGRAIIVKPWRICAIEHECFPLDKNWEM